MGTEDSFRQTPSPPLAAPAASHASPTSPSTKKLAMTWLGVDLTKRRWLFPIVGALATLLAGAAYAFSVFIIPLEQEFGWERSQTITAFSTAMLFFGIFGFVGGLLSDHFGPRIPFLLGTFFMATSQFLASFTSTITMLVLSYGVMLGMGIGLIYGSVTTPLVTRWFPDRENRGLAIGISMIGMGLGSIFAAPLLTWAIENFGWRMAYIGNGIVFLIALSILATIIRIPTNDMIFEKGAGWRHLRPGEDPSAALALFAKNPRDYLLREALSSPYLWLMSALFFLTIFGGLMVVSTLAAYAREAPPVGPGMGITAAAGMLMLLAFFNGLGRPSWGWLSSRVGNRNALVGCPLLMAVGMLLLSTGASGPIFVIGVIATGFAFGGTLALMPLMTTALFGSSYIGRIYGFVYCAGIGFAGFCGPMVGGYLRDSTGAYGTAFYSAATMAIIAATLAALFLPSAGKEQLSKANSSMQG